MYDTVVLGLGGVGSFALRAAARLYRHAYFEHPNYVPWVEFSVKEFKELEKSQDTTLLLECGALMLVPEDNTKLLDAALVAAKEHAIPMELMDHAEVKDRFPQFNYDYHMKGAFEPSAGVVRPEDAIAAALRDAEGWGASIRENTTIQNIREVKDSAGAVSHVEIMVKESDGQEEVIETRSVLVAAGAWTPKLIPSFAPHLRVIRQLQTWVDISKTDNPSSYDSTHMPALVAVFPSLSHPVYALPGDRKADHKYSTCIKLGIHGQGGNTDPDNNPEHIGKEENSEMHEAIKTAFNAQVGSQPLFETKRCMYTMTADDHFMIGVPKEYSKVCVVAGLSGHGFKMTPALGQMLADFAVGNGLEPWKTDFCSPSRFGV